MGLNWVKIHRVAKTFFDDLSGQHCFTSRPFSCLLQIILGKKLPPHLTETRVRKGKPQMIF